MAIDYNPSENYGCFKSCGDYFQNSIELTEMDNDEVLVTLGPWPNKICFTLKASNG
jgi:hypothetical protein